MADFLVIGHRGNGMNKPSSSSSSSSVRENSIRSFNLAANNLCNSPFIEFDVQVTADGHPIIFHDIFILSRCSISGEITEQRVTDLTISQFISFNSTNNHRTLLRSSTESKSEIYSWDFEEKLCTLIEAFESVNPRAGFNIELKFDDEFLYEEEDLVSSLSSVLRVVNDFAGERPVIFSSFHPDAARLIRAMQGTFIYPSVYPVLFLTDAGIDNIMYSDNRRNSIEAAIELCTEYGLQGIVSESRILLRNQENVISRIKELGLVLLSYGEMNDVPEMVRLQKVLGVDGVIVDNVKEIAEIVKELTMIVTEIGEESFEWRGKNVVQLPSDRIVGVA